jgi:hypothetical protein
MTAPHLFLFIHGRRLGVGCPRRSCGLAKRVWHFRELLTATIRMKNTRAAYRQAIGPFFGVTDGRGIVSKIPPVTAAASMDETLRRADGGLMIRAGFRRNGSVRGASVLISKGKSRRC